ncbi:MAG: CpsD/CapB family tyrosine-protein kinase [Clostridiales bacterium]|jgi:capsular exopolysaccharide synthesis family protein|nr:CpsD/CapB family tyrosine-protein kinase [Clostridiales bacterium]MBQ5520413.1 CpsD/CapB family tyrosine-protein kinase [Clostridiales bacterium]
MANKKKAAAPRSNENSMSIIGSKLNFEGREAYNLLRTNLMFATKRNDRNARVIGITSSTHGEGKSLTVINLAYSIAESGRKVILVECDLRLPTLRKKLNLPRSTGLSNILAGINSEKATLHSDVLIKGLDFVQAGDIPPNPSELLGSKAFTNLIDTLADNYDVILLDLPPIGKVSDALVVSRCTDGLVIVVRNDYTNASELDYTLRQCELVDAKVLGFVYNGSGAKSKKYKYGYGNKYAYGYSASHNSNKKKSSQS